MSHPIRIPEGIQQCATCGEYRGRCKARDLSHGYSAEDLAGIPPRYAKVIVEGSENMRPPDEKIIEVSCLCDGIVCPQCKKGRMHRPLSNTYDPVRNEVWHFPHLYYLRGCDACAAERRAQDAEEKARAEVSERERQRAEARKQAEHEQRRRAALAAPPPETPWPHIDRPLIQRGPPGRRLIYGTADSGYLLVVDEEEAWHRAALHRVLYLARTWGEVKERVHPDQYAFFVRWWHGEAHGPYAHEQWLLEQEGLTSLMDPPPPRRRAREPKLDAPFELDGLSSWLSDDGLRYDMKYWFPGDACLRAPRMAAIGTDYEEPFLNLDWDREDKIIEALERAGYTCRRDDELIGAATDWRGPCIESSD